VYCASGSLVSLREWDKDRKGKGWSGREDDGRGKGERCGD